MSVAPCHGKLGACLVTCFTTVTPPTTAGWCSPPSKATRARFATGPPWRRAARAATRSGGRWTPTARKTHSSCCRSTSPSAPPSRPSARSRSREPCCRSAPRRSPVMSQTVLFIHGGWVTPSCWDRFVSYFESRGYRCLAPAWPGKDRSIEAIRADPSPLAGLGIGEIVDHYDRIVRALEEPPILIGHSFGGLFVQVLLDRGLGAAGVAIDSAPPKGVFAFYPTSLLSVGRVLLIPFGWRKVVRRTFTEFRHAFVHTTPREEARAIWQAQIVPDSGRPFFQSAFAAFDRLSPARVDFANPDR